MLIILTNTGHFRPVDITVLIFWKYAVNTRNFALELKNDRRERQPFPSLFQFMNKEQQIELITRLAEEELQDYPSCFLVEVRIKPTNNLQVFLDGEEGVSIAICTSVNKALYKRLEDSELYPSGEFSLEVSSAGLNEPLRLLRQYKKNIGRNVEVVQVNGLKTTGKLLQVNEEGIEVEEVKGKGKKQETIVHQLLFNEIKTTKIQITF